MTEKRSRITSLMVSRLMLNLRISVDKQAQLSGGSRTTIVRDISERVQDNNRKFEDTIIGNLGEGVLFWGEDDEEKDTNPQDEVIELTSRFHYPNYSNVELNRYGISQGWS